MTEPVQIPVPVIGDGLVVAVPKGRILKEVRPFLDAAGIHPEPDFDDDRSRKLRFETNLPNVHIIRVRSFDVATFVAYGGAHLGVCGSDVLVEHDYPDLYAPLDLGIGVCRLSVAEPAHLAAQQPLRDWSHIRVATKYPRITASHFAERGVQAECVKLNGAMELAPTLGLCRLIVDLVSTGSTLKANGLVEVEKIMDVSSRLLVNRAALKTRNEELSGWIGRFREVVHAHAA